MWKRRKSAFPCVDFLDLVFRVQSRANGPRSSLNLEIHGVTDSLMEARRWVLLSDLVEKLFAARFKTAATVRTKLVTLSNELVLSSFLSSWEQRPQRTELFVNRDALTTPSAESMVSPTACGLLVSNSL